MGLERPHNVGNALPTLGITHETIKHPTSPFSLASSIPPNVWSHVLCQLALKGGLKEVWTAW